MNTKTKDDPPRKLKAAQKIIQADRRNCIERLELFWDLSLYTNRQIYAAMLGLGWVWCEGERRWIHIDEGEESHA